MIPRKKGSLQDRVNILREFEKVQGQSGNWNYDAYMHGFYNGIELCLATMEGREPAFKDAPTKTGQPWLRDRSTSIRQRFKDAAFRLMGRPMTSASRPVPSGVTPEVMP